MSKQSAVWVLRLAPVLWLGSSFLTLYEGTRNSGGLLAEFDLVGWLIAIPLFSFVSMLIAFWFAAPAIYRQPESEHPFWLRFTLVLAPTGTMLFLAFISLCR